MADEIASQNDKSNSTKTPVQALKNHRQFVASHHPPKSAHGSPLDSNLPLIYMLLCQQGRQQIIQIKNLRELKMQNYSS